MDAKEILTKSLDLTPEEWDALCNYGHADTFGGDVYQWQEQEKHVVQELAEHYEGNDHSIICNILNRIIRAL